MIQQPIKKIALSNILLKTIFRAVERKKYMIGKYKNSIDIEIKNIFALLSVRKN